MEVNVYDNGSRIDTFSNVSTDLLEGLGSSDILGVTCARFYDKDAIESAVAHLIVTDEAEHITIKCELETLLNYMDSHSLEEVLIHFYQEELL